MLAGYDFILLDLDGTIVDVEPRYVQQVIGEVGDRVGYDFTERQAERLWHGLGGTPDELLVQWGVDRDEFWRTFHRIEDATARADATYLHPDAEALGDVSVPLGVVTHCQPYLTNPVLDRLDIGDWFDTIVCCDDSIGWKPDPTPVEHAMAELSVDPTVDTGVLVGDAASDVGAAWNAGLDGVHVERHDPHRRGCCVRADTRIQRVSELFTDVGPSRSRSAAS